MKFAVVVCNDVQHKVKLVSGVATRKSLKVLKILASIKVTLSGNTMTLSSGNGEQQARVAININTPLEIVKEFCVDAERINTLFNNTSNGDTVNFELKEDFLLFKLGRSRSKLLLTSSDADDYPDSFVFKKSVDRVSVSLADIERTFYRSGYAVSDENEVRKALCNIHVETISGKLYMVSTNGHRLCVSSCPLLLGQDQEKNINDIKFTVSKKFFETLISAFKGKNNEVIFSLSDNLIKVDCGDITVSSLLLNEKYPEYRKVIPQGFYIATNVNRHLLLEAVSKVRSITGITEVDPIQLYIETGGIRVFANNTKTRSESEDYISIKHLAVAQPSQISYSANYLIEALKNSEVDDNGDVQLKVSTGGNGLVFYSQNDAHRNSFALVLPRR